MTAPRTLHVRCATWEEVTTFTSRKLRRGKLLSMKVPFAAEVNAEMTLGLELPNGLVIAIDGTIRKASAVVGDAAGKTWIELELVGFTAEVMARIHAMMASNGGSAGNGASGPHAAVPAPAAPPGPELANGVGADQRRGARSRRSVSSSCRPTSASCSRPSPPSCGECASSPSTRCSTCRRPQGRARSATAGWIASAVITPTWSRAATRRRSRTSPRS